MKGRQQADGTVLYRGQGCGNCPLRQRCVLASATVRTIAVGPNDEAWVRAKRKRRRGWDEPTRALYDRHRAAAEGTNAQLQEQHQLRRARWRGQWKAAVRGLLAATAVNLRKLAGAQRTAGRPGGRPARGLLSGFRRPYGACRGRLGLVERRPARTRLQPRGRGLMVA